jgi:hypothetical protein
MRIVCSDVPMRTPLRVSTHQTKRTDSLRRSGRAGRSKEVGEKRRERKRTEGGRATSTQRKATTAP